MTTQDPAAPATKQDIQMLMESIAHLYDANARWKDEVIGQTKQDAAILKEDNRVTRLSIHGLKEDNLLTQQSIRSLKEDNHLIHESIQSLKEDNRVTQESIQGLKEDNRVMQQSIQVLMEWIGRVVEELQQAKQEFKDDLSLAIETILFEVRGANRDEIEVIKDRVTKLENHPVLQAG